MSRKVIHEMSVEDLVKLVDVKQVPDASNVKEATEAAKFIYALNIQNGDVKVPAQLIYYTYKQWKGWDKRPQPKPLFFKDFTQYFESVRTADDRCYLLDPRPFDMSKENWWLVRKDFREQQAKKKKKSQKTS